MIYNRPWEGTITLEPRSSCGFYVYQYSGFLNIWHQYPLMLYKRDYKNLKYSDTDYAVTVSDPTRNTNPGKTCDKFECENYFYVTYGR